MALSFTQQLDTLYATTWKLRWDGIRDQVMLATPFFYLMDKKGRKKYQTGGSKIEIPLRYKKNETIHYISKGEAVGLQSTEALTLAQYNWKYLTGHIIRYFVDWHQNRGKAKIIDRVKADIDNLQESTMQSLDTDLFGDGTGDNSKAINGLANLIPDTVTSGTVGGIDRAMYAWWRPSVTSMTGKNVSVHLLPYMRTKFNDCAIYGQGPNRFPDMLVTTQTVYESYEAEIAEVARVYTGDKGLADLGFGDLTFKGRPITWDPSCSAYDLFYLNSNHLWWVVDPEVEFDLGDFLPIYDQPRDVVAHMLTACNLVGDNFIRQGKISEIGN